MGTDDGSCRKARRIGLEQSLDLCLQAVGGVFVKPSRAGGKALRGQGGHGLCRTLRDEGGGEGSSVGNLRAFLVSEHPQFPEQ